MTGTIKLVDYRDRTIATIGLFGRPDRELAKAIARWEEYGAVGGYAYNDCGKLLAYV